MTFILRNEKYVGDCEMQKTVTVDFLSHKSIPNNGEAPKFYVTNHHVPIISRTTWTRAQEVLERRSASRKGQKDKKPAKRVGKDVLTIWYAESAENLFTAEPCRQEPRTLRTTGVWMPAEVN